VARERMKHLLAQGALRRLANDGEQVAASTVDYNIEGAMGSPILTSVHDVRRDQGDRTGQQTNIGGLDALSIGRVPRSRFRNDGGGFHPDRIKAVDLFSYSPYVELGDMHRLPYPDNSFDVVFLAGYYPIVAIRRR